MGGFTIKSTFGRKIELFLENHPYYSFNRKEICLGTGIPINTAGVILRRLLRRGAIANPKRGYYQHPSGLIKVIPFYLHGLKFECRCYKTKGRSYRHMADFVTKRFAHPTMHKHKVNHSLVTYTEWEGRWITITLHKSVELIEVWCKCGNMPLTPVEFIAFASWLTGAFDIPSSDWTLKQKGINFDFPNLKIEGGLTELSLEIAQKQILRMYQHDKDFRLEVHDSEPINSAKMKKRILTLLDTVGDINR